MFGKKRRAASDGSATARTSATADPGLAFINRQGADNDAAWRLERAGDADTTAVVTAFEVVDEYVGPAYDPMEFTHPPQELAVTADVRADDARTFPATFPLFLDELDEPPAIGEQINVLLDPADRANVRAKITWRQQVPGGDGILWRVPAQCPNCGAIVDQSTESKAAHPACSICNQPLPCEPAS